MMFMPVLLNRLLREEICAPTKRLEAKLACISSLGITGRAILMGTLSLINDHYLSSKRGTPELKLGKVKKLKNKSKSLCT
jgi:hypothetical protein